MPIFILSLFLLYPFLFPFFLLYFFFFYPLIMPRCHETSSYSLPMFDESDSFSNDLLKYFNSISPNINDKVCT